MFILLRHSEVNFRQQAITQYTQTIFSQCLALHWYWVSKRFQKRFWFRSKFIYQCIYRRKRYNTLCFIICSACLHVIGTLAKDDNFATKVSDIPSIITMVLEGVVEIPFHYQLIESLMLIKNDVWSVSSIHCTFYFTLRAGYYLNWQ